MAHEEMCTSLRDTDTLLREVKNHIQGTTVMFKKKTMKTYKNTQSS